MRQHGGAGPYISRKCSAWTLMFRAGMEMFGPDINVQGGNRKCSARTLMFAAGIRNVRLEH